MVPCQEFLQTCRLGHEDETVEHDLLLGSSTLERGEQVRGEVELAHAIRRHLVDSEREQNRRIHVTVGVQTLASRRRVRFCFGDDVLVANGDQRCALLLHPTCRLSLELLEFPVALGGVHAPGVDRLVGSRQHLLTLLGLDRGSELPVLGLHRGDEEPFHTDAEVSESRGIRIDRGEHSALQLACGQDDFLECLILDERADVPLQRLARVLVDPRGIIREPGVCPRINGEVVPGQHGIHIQPDEDLALDEDAKTIAGELGEAHGDGEHGGGHARERVPGGDQEQGADARGDRLPSPILDHVVGRARLEHAKWPA